MESELRLMAALSGDKAMLEAFAHGADIHTETASRVYGVMPGLVTPEMRTRCKMVNFGIIYGISAFGLSQRLSIPRKEAADLIKIAMVRVYRALKEAGLKTKLVLQIHNELLLDMPKGEEEAVRAIVRDAMVNALDFGVPLEVEIGVGKTWLANKRIFLHLGGSAV